MQQQWRLLPLITASGATQMAIDRWLLQQHQQGKSPPSLRFYCWYPAAISLGYHQRHYPHSWKNLMWQGQHLDIVRRPTGGRAVLHQGDLTYGVVTSGFKGKREQVYRQICQFLIVGWHSLGIELHYGQGGRGYRHQANCFATATAADLVDASRNKIIGSSQVWQRETVLQHGSMRLSPDPQLWQQVFGEAISPSFPQQTPAFQKKIITALIEAASQCFPAEFLLQPLSAAEWQAIESSSAERV